jgi:TonB-linked SusC/RagA family outer membrane protein
LALQGRVPGIFINQNSGVPGGGITVRIQGQNSIDNGNDPLYVVDGVPISSQLPESPLGGVRGNSGGVNLNSGNPLNYINVSDIESIEVLKDADATSIYGSRAANGALLITTKRAKSGNLQFEADVKRGVSLVTRFAKLLNTEQYLTMRKEAFQNDGLPLPNINSNPTDQNYDINGFWDTTRQTDWQKVLLGGKAEYTKASAGISGGNALTRYVLDGTYTRQTTVFPGDYVDRTAAVHVNINSSSQNQKFKLNFTSNYLKDDNKLPSADFTNSALLMAPNAPALYHSDGTLNWAFDASGIETWNNPAAGVTNKYINKTNNLVSSLLLSYCLLPGFEMKANIGYTSMHTAEVSTTTTASIQPRYRAFLKSSALFEINEENNWITEPQLIYSKSLGVNELNALIGSTILQNSASLQGVRGTDYSSDDALEDQSAASTLIPGGGSLTRYRYRAVFGRAEYNRNNKYLINATLRKDGSSRFGPSSRFHTFWSIGGGWVLSEEKSLQSAFPALSFGKVRFSYGTTGNDQIADYSFFDLYRPIYFGVNYQDIPSLATANFFNPHLQWEETKKLQAGIDLGFIKDRLLFNFTFQSNRSSNQLLNYQLPYLTGFGGITSNFPATVRNNSFELSVNAAIVKSKSFKWTANLNLTIAKNTLVAFPMIDSSAYADKYVVGQPITIKKVFHSLGVHPETGDYLFVDNKGNETFSPYYKTDTRYFVNTAPQAYGGFQNTFDFKRFQLDFFFQFAKQRAIDYQIYNGDALPGTYFPRFLYNQPVSVLNRWRKPGDVASVAKFSTNSFTTYVGSSDYIYGDASYVRLKNISLSWEISDRWLQYVHLKSVKLFFQAQNLFTITEYQGTDPESGSYISLPPLKTWVVGINLVL